MSARYLSLFDWVLLLKLGGIAVLVLWFLAREIMALRRSLRYLNQQIARAESQQEALRQRHQQELDCASQKLRFRFTPQNPPCP